MVELKGASGCSICGERHPACLQFHHDSGEKEIEIATAVRNNWSWRRIEKEISKCVIICANCHLRHHFKRGQKRAFPRRIRKAYLHDEG